MGDYKRVIFTIDNAPNSDHIIKTRLTKTYGMCISISAGVSAGRVCYLLGLLGPAYQPLFNLKTHE